MSASELLVPTRALLVPPPAELILPGRGRERLEEVLHPLAHERREGPAFAARAESRALQVLRDHAPALLAAGAVPEHEARVLRRLLVCRTPGLGGHLVCCPGCEQSGFLPHACRDRHCPTCPTVRQLRWLEQRNKRALDLPHFHAVLTVAAELRPLFLENQRLLYRFLMAAAATTVRSACRRVLGDARLAFVSVLHTWNRALEYHPHVHVLLAAGGLAPDGSSWIVPERVLLPADDYVRGRFRGALLLRIRRARQNGALRLPPGWDEGKLDRALERAAERRWYVYSKQTVRSQEACEYLARYTSRVGLTAARLVDYDGETVTLSTPRGGVRLSGAELVRRFVRHVLPRGFVRIRYQGLFVSRHAENHALARRRIAEQGVGCGFAAELEGRTEGDGPEEAASREREGGGDSWQEVCTRNGFAVERCRRCDTPLEYTLVPPCPSLTQAFLRSLSARAAARARVGPPPPRPG